MSRPHRILPLALCFVVFDVTAATQRHARISIADERAEFIRTYKNVESGIDTGAAGSEALRAYPSVPLSAGCAIAPRCARCADARHRSMSASRRFSRSHGTAPVARELRHAWLTSLGAAQPVEHAFSRTTSTASADDALRCQSFSARIELARTEGLAGRHRKAVADAAEPAGMRARVRMVAQPERADARISSSSARVSRSRRATSALRGK